jgi:predicted RNase H-like nuclease
LPLVLGLDAAWTANGSSGVALVDTDYQLPRVVAVTPGYGAFSRLGHGEPVHWIAKLASGEPPLEELLSVAEKLAEKPVDVIVVDMPLSHAPITGRRPADRAISAAFGGRGCSTHSPSAERPGPIGESVRHEAGRLGYPLITTAGKGPRQRALLETYPHPALLHLTGAEYRIPYKVQRSRRYWPRLALIDRRTAVARELSFIRQHLDSVLANVDLDIQATASVARLKAVEDAIDALVCCWVGARWLAGAAEPYGDEAAAIWVPHPLAGP